MGTGKCHAPGVVGGEGLSGRMGKGGPTTLGLIAALRLAACRGRHKLLPPVWEDCDDLEVHWCGNQFRSARHLVGVKAKVRVSFVVPLARMPPGMALEVRPGEGSGCWLAEARPGAAGRLSDSPVASGALEEPLDLMEAAFPCPEPGRGSDGDALLALIVLPELARAHRFTTTRGWADLAFTYEAADFRYAVTPAGMEVTFVIEATGNRQ